MAKLEASGTHRTVNVSHEQMGTDLLTLSAFSASSSYRKLEKHKKKKPYSSSISEFATGMLN